ncbi:putative Fe-Mo cluster-binding NifX family protein [Thermovibrio guaymasensis]|uniref:Putative Fe-Mo cluster-binding NifX family protein n=1 Tax=Thermovibrio guaymasensis TaxID=240167 RepID=A0A420W9S7_9BACT|nr:NifB/NifX family molybdenum-iron cluster-binding protein [Thermovibrio guaymasensis]RKQ64057.1 putative Fe-Mo cluster-binding NifX family protein [Thermovibrio guaymasensis]
MILAIPVEENRNRVSLQFGPAPGFVLVDTSTGERRFVENTYSCGGCKEGCGEGKNAADLLAEEEVDALLVISIPESPLIKLMRKGIVVYKLPSKVETVEEAIEAFEGGKADVLYLSHF